MQQLELMVTSLTSKRINIHLCIDTHKNGIYFCQKVLYWLSVTCRVQSYTHTSVHPPPGAKNQKSMPKTNFTARGPHEVH